jgi:hypothetical protein
MRTINSFDLQAVFLFFGKQAAKYFSANRTLPPACVLVWLEPEAPVLKGLHQFPDDQVMEMLKTEEGKMQLASAMQAILNPDTAGVEVPDGPRPDLVVQVLLACDAKQGHSKDKEAILILVHTPDATHAVAVPVDAFDGRVDLPKEFDVVASRVAVSPETDPDEP